MNKISHFLLLAIAFLVVAIPVSKVSAQTTLTACDADITEDGTVNISDYSLLVTDFFSNNPSNSRTDINQDGSVNLTDYSLLASFFFTDCEPEATPSPTPTASATPSPSPSPSVIPSPTPTPTPSPTPVTSLYGPQNVVGPVGASIQTCDGIANCSICSPTSCDTGGVWDTKIAQAQPGDTILLRGGDYDKSVPLQMPKGTSSNKINIANYNGEIPVIKTNLSFTNSSHLAMEGVAVRIGAEYGNVFYIRATSNGSLITDLTFKNVEVRGGESDAIRIRGNVQNLEFRDSSLDGGSTNHVVKVLCDDVSNEPSSCNMVPENISFIGNEFSKNKSSFFPKRNSSGELVCADEASGGSGDLIQLEGAGSATIQYNSFGFSKYEDCLDIKGEGRPGASLNISNNFIDSTGEGEQACTEEYSGCRIEGLMVHGSQHTGEVRITDNHFLGGGNLFRTSGDDSEITSNLFEDTRIRIQDTAFQMLNNVFAGTSTCLKPDGYTCQ